MIATMKVCAICGKVHLDSYMVHNELWSLAGLHPREVAHAACFETRIGRRLTIADLMAAPINDEHFFWAERKA